MEKHVWKVNRTEGIRGFLLHYERSANRFSLKPSDVESMGKGSVGCRFLYTCAKVGPFLSVSLGLKILSGEMGRWREEGRDCSAVPNLFHKHVTKQCKLN